MSNMTRKLGEAIDAIERAAYSNGWDDGYADGKNEAEGDGYAKGYADGLEAARQALTAIEPPAEAQEPRAVPSVKAVQAAEARGTHKAVSEPQDFWVEVEVPGIEYPLTYVTNDLAAKGYYVDVVVPVGPTNAPQVGRTVDWRNERPSLPYVKRVLAVNEPRQPEDDPYYGARDDIPF